LFARASHFIWIISKLQRQKILYFTFLEVELHIYIINIQTVSRYVTCNNFFLSSNFKIRRYISLSKEEWQQSLQHYKYIYLAEDDMLAVEPGGLLGGDEELGTIGILT